MWHWPLMQQPDGHELESHTHMPLVQCWPEPQALLKPHLH
jgi:hypothetical protein